jgi:drug/metabolite transporter (DMT)-like permease
MVYSRGLVLTALSGMMYGLLGYFGAQLIQEKLSVPTFLFWRFLIAAVLVAGLCIPQWMKKSWDHSAFWTSFFLGGLLYSGSAAFYFLASEWIGTGLAMVIFFSYPVFVILLSWKFDQKKLTRSTSVALTIVFLGFILLSDGKLSQFDWRGVFFAVISALFYAFYVYVSKKQVQKLSSLESTFVVCLGCMATFLCVSLFEGSFAIPSTSWAWISVFGIGLICTALPILFLLEGLKTMDAGKASILSVLEPVVTVVIGTLFLNETIALAQWVGIVIVLSGAILVQMERVTS